MPAQNPAYRDSVPFFSFTRYTDMKARKTKKWFDGIAYEVAFWRNVFRWKHTREGLMNWSHYGSAITLDCFDANVFLTDVAEDHAPLVLDVGCGMSYATGNMMGAPGNMTPINLHYIDPLAHYFNEILKATRQELPAIEFGMMEYLSAFYPHHDVDLVIIQNALDHSADPLKGILEAIDTLRTGGILYLKHKPNEGETEKYKGFHQWNIDIEDERLCIWNKEHRTYVDEMISAFASIEVHRHAEGYVIAVITKKGAVEPRASVCDKPDIATLCTMMMENHRVDVKLWNATKLKLSYWKYNTIQFVVQAMPWKMKMAFKKMIHQK